MIFAYKRQIFLGRFFHLRISAHPLFTTAPTRDVPMRLSVKTIKSFKITSSHDFLKLILDVKHPPAAQQYSQIRLKNFAGSGFIWQKWPDAITAPAGVQKP